MSSFEVFNLFFIAGLTAYLIAEWVIGTRKKSKLDDWDENNPNGM